MAEASLLAGLAISHTRTALCHSISYPLTAHFGVPHGVACAFTMPAVVALNRNIDDGRLSMVEDLIGLGDLPKLLHGINEKLGVTDKVRSHVMSIDNLYGYISEMLTPGRADNNLYPVDEKMLQDIIERSYGEKKN